MRVTSPRLPLALLLAASAFALTGCSPEAAVPSAPPSAEAEPLFASDEEALAAAEAAYAEYLAIADAVLIDGGANAQRLETVAIGDVLEEDLERAADYQREGRRQEGQTRVLEMSLQQLLQDSSNTEVITYACLDSFSIEIVDESGALIGNPERDATVTFELRFEAERNGKLLLAESDVWTSGQTCE